MIIGNPWALLLFGLIPVLIYISRNRLRHLSRLRRWSAIALRLLLYSLLVLALADLRWAQKSEDLSVVFLLDHSDSMSAPAREAALTYINTALTDKPTDDTAGLIVFGANAVVDANPQHNPAWTTIASSVNGSYTNFAEAIRLGMAIFPPDSPKRLVLLSEGKNNLGNPQDAAQLAQAAGIELSTVNLLGDENASQTAQPDARVTAVDAPSALAQGETFDLAVTVQSNTSQPAELRIFAEERLIANETVNLAPGENRFVYPLTAGAQGFSSFQAQVIPQADSTRQNNRLDAFSLIEGPPQVLIAATDAAEAQPLLNALAAGGLQPILMTPAEIPADPLALSTYAAVVLVNVPAPDLSPRQMDLLQLYVRDLGRGLVMVGGPESYGAGGYFDTPIEAALPVNMAIRDRERLPGMTMMMVIDKSGSMESAGMQGMGGLRKIELAKEAIYRAVDLLAPWDRVGVVAFDNAARVVLEPVNVDNVQRIKDRVGTLRASGGTDILAGLEAGAGLILPETTNVRHIVLLTDGGANPNGIPELVEELVANEVSVSVVAIGDDYAPFLEEVAQAGQGRFHFARNAGTIPQIFAQEAALASRAYIVEEAFTPKLVGTGPALTGIDGLPPLYGYIATEPKIAAQHLLVTGQEDPLLSQWQYGLGRSVAWTSDATDRWATDWLTWPGFAQFWSQVVRWTIIERPPGQLESRIAFDETTGQMTLQVEAITLNGDYLNNLALNGNLVQFSPQQQTTAITLTQVAPGLYQTSFRPEGAGTYLLQVAGVDRNGETVTSGMRGFVVGYSPEYAAENPTPNLLADLARLGGGSKNLAAADVFAHTLPPVSGSQPLWPYLLIAFVVLLPFDVGLRRIIFGRDDIRLGWQKLISRLGIGRSKPVAATPQSSTASSLLSIKEQNPDNTSPAVKTAEPPKHASPSPASPAPPKVVIHKPKPAKSSPAAQETPPPNDDADRMSRLLKAKRRARNKPDD